MTGYLSFQVDLNQPEIVAAYDELPLWSAMFGLLMLKHLPFAAGLTVLDLGCGTGFPLIELAQRLGPSCKVYGMDPWEAARRRAAFKARLWKVGNVEVLPGEGSALPFGDEALDLIVSNLGVNNFDDPPAVLKECWRTARPGARLVLTTNLQGHMQEFYQVYEETLLELGLQDALPALHLHITHRGTIEGISVLLEQAGFTVAAVHEETAVMRFLDGTALLNHAFIKLGFLDGWKSLIPGEVQQVFFTRLEENLNRRANAAGGLSLTIPMAYIEGLKTLLHP